MYNRIIKYDKQKQKKKEREGGGERERGVNLLDLIHQ